MKITNRYEQLAADLAQLQGPAPARDFHAERVRDQIIRGNGGGFNSLQVRQVLDTIDSRRTGHLDEVQATAALRNMGLAVTNHEAASFLRTVATANHGSGTCVLLLLLLPLLLLLLVVVVV